MPFTNDLPEWNKGDDAKPAQSKLDTGWTAEEKPPASIFNWFFNRAYLAIKNLRDNAIHKEEKGQPNGVASLDGMGKVPTAQLPTQNGFTTFKVGATNVIADSGADILELVAGTNITLTPDAENDKVTFGVNGLVKSEDFAAHQAESMPHKFTDTTDSRTYRYGFKTNATKDGLIFVYEEVL